MLEFISRITIRRAVSNVTGSVAQAKTNSGTIAGVDAALRAANKTAVPANFKGKLDHLARPFNSLVTGLSAQRGEGFGFGVMETDLKATMACENTRRLLSLEFQSQARVKRHLIHLAMQMFCRRVNDTGSPEVQAAIWSLKIAALQQHVQINRHDYVAERKIVEWKDQRRKILRYLKRVSLERYFTCVDRLGLPHDLVVVNPSVPTPPKVRPKSKEGLRKLAARPKK